MVKIKKLQYLRSNKGGRNNQGILTVRGRCQKPKLFKYRINYQHGIWGIRSLVMWVGNVHGYNQKLALIRNANSGMSYSIACENMHMGQEIENGDKCRNRLGNNLPLYNIDLTADISLVERVKGKGSGISRAPGTKVRVIRKHSRLGYVTLKMPSKKIDYVRWDCMGTIGKVSNENHFLTSYGKAGTRVRLGFKSKVRGVAKNPVDHPMGGGEGKSSGGRPGCSPWGWKTKGPKTRNQVKIRAQQRLRSQVNKYYD